MDSRIRPWELLDLLGEEEVVVVDCRDGEERARIPLQIPGALQMAAEEIREAPWALPDDELIVLYDGMRESTRCKSALGILRMAGRRVVALDGGLHAWIANGYPTERLDGAAWPAGGGEGGPRG